MKYLTNYDTIILTATFPLTAGILMNICALREGESICLVFKNKRVIKPILRTLIQTYTYIT